MPAFMFYTEQSDVGSGVLPSAKAGIGYFYMEVWSSDCLKRTVGCCVCSLICDLQCFLCDFVQVF